MVSDHGGDRYVEGDDILFRIDKGRTDAQGPDHVVENALQVRGGEVAAEGAGDRENAKKSDCDAKGFANGGPFFIQERQRKEKREDGR